MNNSKEGFQIINTDVEITHPDFAFRRNARASIVGEDSIGAAENYVGDDLHYESKIYEDNHHSVDMNEYVLKSDIERAARESARRYCPVPPDYNPNDFIKKSQIDFEKACPKLPDLKDYVLKSTIPPVQKCPACVCPKVKVSAGMCKECPPQKNNCPKCEPCGVEQCKDVIKCASHEKQVSCPKCPPPMPCPEPPEKVCPAFEMPESNIKCPSPKPCPLPEPCPDKQGRCPEQPESKCKYYGMKEVVKERPVNELVNEMLLSDDPKLKDLLENLKSKLDINLHPSPTQTRDLQRTLNKLNNQTTSVVPTTSHLQPKPTNIPKTTTSPMPMPVKTTSCLVPETEMENVYRFNPRSHNNADEQYEFNSYRYSSLNRLDYLGDPQPTYNSNVESETLDGANAPGCDINNGNCSYNTNLNI